MSTTPTPEKQGSLLRPIEFEWPLPFKSSVVVVGEWNNWDQAASKPLQRPKNVSTAFPSTVVHLPAGEFKYKFLVDGEWRVVESAPTTLMPDGSTANVVIVPLSDDVSSSLKPSSLYEVGVEPFKRNESGSDDDVLSLVSSKYLRDPIWRVPIADAVSLSSSLRVHKLYKNRSLKLDIPPPKLLQVRGNMLEAFVDFGRVARFDSLCVRGLFEEAMRLDCLPHVWDNKYFISIKYHTSENEWVPLCDRYDLSQTFLNSLPSDGDNAAALLDFASGSHHGRPHHGSPSYTHATGWIHLPVTSARRLLVQLHFAPADLSLRPAPALSSMAPVNFKYSSDFDNNGLLYWLGTNGGRKIYENPALEPHNPIKLEISAPRMSRAFKMSRESIVAHTYSSSQPIYWGGAAPVWFSVDLGAERKFRPSAYSLRHGYHSGNSYLQNWEFQVSQDGTSWTTIHAGGKSGFSKAFDTKTFFIDSSNSGVEPSRFFRVVQRGNYGVSTGQSLSSHGMPLMCIAGFELYGELFQIGNSNVVGMPSSNDVNVLKSLQLCWKSFDNLIEGAPDVATTELNTQTFKYESDFDSNGVIHFIGTDGRSWSSWSNPAKTIPGVAHSPQIKIEISDSESQVPKEAIVGRTAPAADVSWGKGSEDRWVSLDLSHKHRLKCSYFTIRNGIISPTSLSKLQVQNRVELQASHDGSSWKSICTADLEESFSNTPSAVASVSVTTTAVVPDEGFYQFFRLVDRSVAKDSKSADSGEDSAPKERVFSIGGLELYGEKIVPDEDEDQETLTKTLTQEEVRDHRRIRHSLSSSSANLQALLRQIRTPFNTIEADAAVRRNIWRFLLDACRYCDRSISAELSKLFKQEMEQGLLPIIENNIISSTPSVSALAVIFLTRAASSLVSVGELAMAVQKAALFVFSSGSTDSLFIHDNGKMLFRLLKWTFSHLHDQELLFSAASILAKTALSCGQTVSDRLQKTPQYSVLRGCFGVYGNALEQQLFTQTHATSSPPLFEQSPSPSNAEAPMFVTFEQIAQKRFSEDSIRKDITEALADVELNRAQLLKLLEPVASDPNDLSSIMSISKRSELLASYSRCLESLNTLAILQRQLHRLGFALSEKLPFSASLDRDCWLSRELLHLVRDVVVHLPSGLIPKSLGWMFQGSTFASRSFSLFCTSMGDSARERAADIITAVLSRAGDAELANFVVDIMKTHFSFSSAETSPQFFLFECLNSIFKSPLLQAPSTRVLLKIVSSFPDKNAVDSSALPWILMLLSSLLLGHKREKPHPDSRCRQCGISPICGTRWRCLNCPNFDLCGSCEANQLKAGDHDPATHCFIKIPTPLPLFPFQKANTLHPIRKPLYSETATSGTSISKMTHKGSKCARCGLSPIIGLRWQCAVCPNYNLCDKCESSTTSSTGSKDAGAHNPRHHLVKLTRAIPDASFSDTNPPILNFALHPCLYSSRSAVMQRRLSSKEIHLSLSPHSRNIVTKTAEDASTAILITDCRVRSGSVGQDVLNTLLRVLKELLSSPASAIHKDVESILAVSRSIQDLAPYLFTAEDIYAVVVSDNILPIVSQLQALCASSKPSSENKEHPTDSDWFSDVDPAQGSGGDNSNTEALSPVVLRLLRSEVVHVIHNLVSESSSTLHHHPAARLARSNLRSRLIAAFLDDPKNSPIVLEVLNIISSSSDLQTEEEEAVMLKRRFFLDDHGLPKSRPFSSTADTLLIFRPLIRLLPSILRENLSNSTQAIAQVLSLLSASYEWASSNGLSRDLLSHVPFRELWRAIHPFAAFSRGTSFFAENLKVLIQATALFYPELLWQKIGALCARDANSPRRAEESFSIEVHSMIVSALGDFPVKKADPLPGLLGMAISCLAGATDVLKIGDQVSPDLKDSVQITSTLFSKILACLSATSSSAGPALEKIWKQKIFVESQPKDAIPVLLKWYGSFDSLNSSNKKIGQLTENTSAILLRLASHSAQYLERIIRLVFDEFKAKQTSLLKDLLVTLSAITIGGVSGARIMLDKLDVLDFCATVLNKLYRSKPSKRIPDQTGSTIQKPQTQNSVKLLHLNQGAKRIAAQEATLNRALKAAPKVESGHKALHTVPLSQLSAPLPTTDGLENLSNLATAVGPSDVSRLQSLLRSDANSYGVSWAWNFGTSSSLQGFFGGPQTTDSNKKPANPFVALTFEFPTIVHVGEVRMSFNDGGSNAAPESITTQTAVGRDLDSAQFTTCSFSSPSKEADDNDSNYRGIKIETATCSVGECCRFLRLILRCPAKKFSSTAITRIQILGYTTPYMVISQQDGRPGPSVPKQQSRRESQKTSNSDKGSTASLPSVLAILSTICQEGQMLSDAKLARLLEIVVGILDTDDVEDVLLRLVNADVKRVAPQVFELLLSAVPVSPSHGRKTSDCLGKVLAAWSSGLSGTHSMPKVPWEKLVSRVFDPSMDSLSYPLISALADAIISSTSGSSDFVLDTSGSSDAVKRIGLLLRKTTADPENNRHRSSYLRLLCALLAKASDSAKYWHVVSVAADEIGPSSYPAVILLASTLHELSGRFISSGLATRMIKDMSADVFYNDQTAVNVANYCMQALRTGATLSPSLRRWISEGLLEKILEVTSWNSPSQSSILSLLRILVAQDARSRQLTLDSVVRLLGKDSTTKLSLDLLVDYLIYEAPVYVRLFPRGPHVPEFRLATSSLCGNPIDMNRWDATKCDRHLELSDDRFTVRLNSSSAGFQWRSLFAERPITRTLKHIEIVLENSLPNPNIMIGLSERMPDPLPPCIGQNPQYKSYMWSAANHGPLYSSGQVISSYGRSPVQGDVIGVHVDLDACTMSFSINGESLGDAFTNVSAEGTEGLYFCMSLFTSGLCLRLQSGASSKEKTSTENEPFGVISALTACGDANSKVLEVAASTKVSALEETANAAISGKHCAKFYVGDSLLSRSDSISKYVPSGTAEVSMALSFEEGDSAVNKEEDKANTELAVAESAKMLLKRLLNDDATFSEVYKICSTQLAAAAKEDKKSLEESVTAKLMEGSDSSLSSKQRMSRRQQSQKPSMSPSALLELLDTLQILRECSKQSASGYLTAILESPSACSVFASLLTQVRLRLSAHLPPTVLPEVEETAHQYPSIIIWDGITKVLSDSKVELPPPLVGRALIALSELADLAPVNPTHPSIRRFASVWEEKMKAREEMKRLQRELEAAARSASGKQHWAKGTGYGTEDDLNNQDPSTKWSHEKYMRNAAITQRCTVRLLRLLRTSFNGSEEMNQMVQASCLLPLLESYLRNDSLLDMERAAQLYVEMFQLLKDFSAHQHAASECFLKPLREGSSDSVFSLVSRIHKIAVAAEIVAKKKEKAPDVPEVAPTKIKSSSRRAKAIAVAKSAEQKAAEQILLSEMTAAFKALEKLNVENTPSRDNESHSSNTLSEEADLEQKYCEALQELLFGETDMAKADASNLREKYSEHHYDARICQEISPAPHKMKRLINEISALSIGLPLHLNSSIFLRVDSERIDVMKCAITGPKGTPYENGVFVFDVFCPAEYPASPPLVNLQTTGNGTMRFNPNLYNCGKVCLSLLGTWRGGPNEQWNEQTSTLLQVFVSIQSLILVEEPYFNEPGYESSMGTPEGTAASNSYNETIKLGTLRWAMLEQLRAPAKGFEEIIQVHFKLKKQEILKQCDSWLKEMKVAASNPTSKVITNSFGNVVPAGASAANYEKMKQLVEEIKALLAKIESGEPVTSATSTPSSSSADTTENTIASDVASTSVIQRWIATDELMDAFPTHPLGLLYKALEINEDQLQESLEWTFLHGDKYLKDDPEIAKLQPPDVALEAMTDRQLQNVKLLHFTMPVSSSSSAFGASLPSIVPEFEDYGAMDQGSYDFVDYPLSDDEEGSQTF